MGYAVELSFDLKTSGLGYTNRINIINTNNFQVYTLLTKFRVMSAISDDNFMFRYEVLM